MKVKINGSKGKPVKKADIITYVKEHEKAVKANKAAMHYEMLGGIRNAELFTWDKIEDLKEQATAAAAAQGRKFAGIRVYIGLAYEKLDVASQSGEISTKLIAGGDPVQRPRFFLVAIDEDGNDIDFDFKEMKDPGGDGLGGGLPCPPYGAN